MTVLSLSKHLKPLCLDIRSPALPAILLKPESLGLPHTCSYAGGGGSKDLPAVLVHDQQLHLLLGRHIFFLEDQEFTVPVQEVLILDTRGTG